MFSKITLEEKSFKLECVNVFFFMESKLWRLIYNKILKEKGYGKIILDLVIQSQSHSQLYAIMLSLNQQNNPYALFFQR